MKSKILLITGIVSLLILAIIAYLALHWLLLFKGIQSQPDPARPEMTYGEFPFSLVYSINGETKVIEDTLICEYDGIGVDEGHGKYRKWKEHLAKGNQKILLLNTDGAPGIVFRNKKTLNQLIHFDPGPAWYYMGESGQEYKPIFPNASFSEQYQNGSSSEGIIQADQLLKEYNIKLVSWNPSPPIKNDFSK